MKEFLKYLFSKKEIKFTIVITVICLCSYIILLSSTISGELAYYVGGNTIILILTSSVLFGYYVGSYFYWKKNVKTK